MTKILLKNGMAFTRSGFERRDILLSDGRIALDPSGEKASGAEVFDAEGFHIVPGFVDVHVHLREPGFSYKESIASGSAAAAHGGYTGICAMPNLNPPPSNVEDLSKELEIIRESAVIPVYPYGTITRDRSGRGVLSDMEGIAPYVVGFSDDGTGVQEEGVMRAAMEMARKLGKPVVAHCEDEGELSPEGCVHDGLYARRHGLKGINSASEWKQVERDVSLVRETGSRYHVCHVSTKESVRIIREAKAEGLPVSCETGPHYLMFTDMDLEEDGGWKMNPPIRGREDREALLEGIRDGTIDCIITDHAPHSLDEKSRGLAGSAFGIPGLETCFPSLYHNLVLRNPETCGESRVDRARQALPGEGAITLERLVELMAVNPRRIFSLPGPLYIEEGADADIAVLDLSRIYLADPSVFYTKAKKSLFSGMEMQGETVKTFVGGREVYDRRRGISLPPQAFHNVT